MRKFILGLICLLALTHPALAQHTQDMFDNQTYYEDQARFYEPGSSAQNADLFGNRQGFIRDDKDMFDHVRADAFGPTDMFNPRLRQEPYGRLFDWPQGSQQTH